MAVLGYMQCIRVSKSLFLISLILAWVVLFRHLLVKEQQQYLTIYECNISVRRNFAL